VIALPIPQMAPLEPDGLDNVCTGHSGDFASHWTTTPHGTTAVCNNLSKEETANSEGELAIPDERAPTLKKSHAATEKTKASSQAPRARAASKQSIGGESHLSWESNRSDRKRDDFKGVGTMTEQLTAALSTLLPIMESSLQTMDGMEPKARVCVKVCYPLLQHLHHVIQVLPDNDQDIVRQTSQQSLYYDTVCSTQELKRQSSPLGQVKRLALAPTASSQTDQVIFTPSQNSKVEKGVFVSSNNLCYIHPEKPFRLSWDASSLLLILIVSIFVPLELTFFLDTTAPDGFIITSAIIDIFFGIDILFNFFTAYHEGHGLGGELRTDLGGIALHYVRGWFALDFVASVPYMTFLQLMTGAEEEDNAGGDAARMIKMLKYAKLARVMKVLRVLKLGGLMQIVEEKMVAAQSMTVMFQLSKMTVVMLILAHNFACLWYGVASQVGTDSSTATWLHAQDLWGAPMASQYVAAFYFAISTGTTVGYGDIHPTNTAEQAVTSFLLVASVGYIGQFLGRVSQMVNTLRQSENKMVQTKRELLLFMTKREVAKSLQFKVLRYIEHTHDTQALTFLDGTIMDNLSESLQSELALAIIGNVYRSFPLFADCEDDFLTALCSVGKTKRAGIGDVIVSEEQAAHEMFWVVRGEARVERRGKLINLLSAGDWFGELALFFPGAVRVATVRCESHCEFLVLHHNDFNAKMKDFPRVRRFYLGLARELKKGNPAGLNLRCLTCGSKDHLSRDCPCGPMEIDSCSLPSPGTPFSPFTSNSKYQKNNRGRFNMF